MKTGEISAEGEKQLEGMDGTIHLCARKYRGTLSMPSISINFPSCLEGVGHLLPRVSSFKRLHVREHPSMGCARWGAQRGERRGEVVRLTNKLAHFWW